MAIEISVGMNVALLVIDRLPFLCILISCGAQGAYWTLLKRFPFMELTSPEFLGSVGMLILNHFMRMRHFKHDDRVRPLRRPLRRVPARFLPHGGLDRALRLLHLPRGERVRLGSGGVGLKGGGASSDGLSGGGGFPAGAAYGTLDGGGGGRRKRANVVLQVLDFGKAQWDKFTKKNLPGVLPGGMYTGSYKERTF